MARKLSDLREKRAAKIAEHKSVSEYEISRRDLIHSSTSMKEFLHGDIRPALRRALAGAAIPQD